MRSGGGAMAGRRRKRKFELAWQPVEFRMERRPFPGDLARRTRIDKLIVRDAGEMIRGHIANAIAGCLDRMHLHGRPLGEDVRHLFELGPVELHVLSLREMTEALVVRASNVAQHPQLSAGKQPFRNSEHHITPFYEKM